MSNLTEAKSALDRGGVLLVDVREPAEFATGRLPAAKLVPLAGLEESARSWKREQPVVVYCQAGRRGEKAQGILTGLGFAHVTNIEGGFSAWAAAGLPVEKSAHAPWSLERQVRFTVAIFVILFTTLGLWVHPGFFLLDFLIAGGLIVSALTNTCGMALVLTKLPWNRVRQS